MNAAQELLKLKNDELAQHLMRFFKTGKGQYGEGDKFLGIRAPKTREIAKKYYKTTPLTEIQSMLDNPYHEIRLCALLMMVFIYEKTDRKEEIVNLYLKNTKNINNWDLVDNTAHKIIGAHYIKTKNPEIIKKLAESNHLWSERIAVVAQWSIVKTKEYALLLDLCEKFLTHRHDLMHKAVGWMLREAGKQDEAVLLGFLDKHCKTMPRTALRYAIERLSPGLRQYYMKK
ncbi:TPA: DNA alkylation repair protein [Candidatus Spyradomonas excrementavium]|nr:DNA alkylation repair protein [Candidatus Spyradomonas excrementavium]